MSHYCICPKCNQRFDRDKIQAVQVSSRRYGHATCYPENKNFIPLVISIEDNENYKNIMSFIKDTFKETANYPLIKKQIKNFVDKGYSLSGIYKSLIYFFKIKNNSIEKTNGGIGIVEYCYNDAFNYYYDLFVAKSQNENVNIEEYTTKVREITIPLPAIKEKKRFFNLEDDEE